MRRFANLRALIYSLLLTCVPTPAQQVTLKARVQVTREGRHLKNASQAVIWLTPLGNTPAGALPTQKESEIPKLIQRDKSFEPSLLVIPVGGKVEFPNHDPFFHNVFSLFDGKRFDLGLYESGTTRYVQFDKAGISYIFCNIHAQMGAVIIALTTPYYSISNVRGEITIPNVPPGRYELRVFHSSASPDALQALSREITITPADSFIGTFTLEESSIAHAHTNKYGRDYDPPQPDSPAYARP